MAFATRLLKQRRNLRVKVGRSGWRNGGILRGCRRQCGQTTKKSGNQCFAAFGEGNTGNSAIVLRLGSLLEPLSDGV